MQYKVFVFSIIISDTYRHIKQLDSELHITFSQERWSHLALCQHGNVYKITQLITFIWYIMIYIYIYYKYMYKYVYYQSCNFSPLAYGCRLQYYPTVGYLVVLFAHGDTWLFNRRMQWREITNSPLVRDCSPVDAVSLWLFHNLLWLDDIF